MSKIKITNLETLRYEKQRLQELSAQKEQELKDTLDYIQENAGMILLRSFFPKKNTENNSTFEFIHGIVGSSLDTIVDLVSDKENRKENLKNLAKKLLSELIYKFMKK
jgi:phage-related minor tail protein